MVMKTGLFMDISGSFMVKPLGVCRLNHKCDKARYDYAFPSIPTARCRRRIATCWS
jgi:hypothetical protein